jgi:hypothetical protein
MKIVLHLVWLEFCGIFTSLLILITIVTAIWYADADVQRISSLGGVIRFSLGRTTP